MSRQSEPYKTYLDEVMTTKRIELRQLASETGFSTSAISKFRSGELAIQRDDVIPFARHLMKLIVENEIIETGLLTTMQRHGVTTEMLCEFDATLLETWKKVNFADSEKIPRSLVAKIISQKTEVQILNYSRISPNYVLKSGRQALAIKRAERESRPEAVDTTISMRNVLDAVKEDYFEAVKFVQPSDVQRLLSHFDFYYQLSPDCYTVVEKFQAISVPAQQSVLKEAEKRTVSLQAYWDMQRTLHQFLCVRYDGQNDVDQKALTEPEKEEPFCALWDSLADKLTSYYSDDVTDCSELAEFGEHLALMLQPWDGLTWDLLLAYQLLDNDPLSFSTRQRSLLDEIDHWIEQETAEDAPETELATVK